jgi:hypothetical protein
MSFSSSKTWFNDLLNGTICQRANAELKNELDVEKSARFRMLFLSMLHQHGEALVTDFENQCMRGTDVECEKLFGKSPKCTETVCISKNVFDKFEQDYLSRYHHEKREDGSRLYFARRRDSFPSVQKKDE